MNIQKSSQLLYFRCHEGHLTPCTNTKHRLFFCKPCNSILQKKDCDRFTDSAWVLNSRKSKAVRIEHNGKTLYKFPESFRRNYKRKKKEVSTTS